VEFSELLTHENNFKEVKIKAIKCPEISLNINKRIYHALIDSGSEITCIQEEFYKKLKSTINQGDFKELPGLFEGINRNLQHHLRPANILYATREFKHSTFNR
ncbi:retropepsin-like aspartic protease, partial [Klebsiella pneumoniae]|uniref:retropepsin-like aspartic protease n=1 Tax=Klebsiella pneumoniae TaxID=573 RepID=UPI0040557A8E